MNAKICKIDFLNNILLPSDVSIDDTIINTYRQDCEKALLGLSVYRHTLTNKDDQNIEMLDKGVKMLAEVYLLFGEVQRSVEAYLLNSNN